jgi:hypothetical protein
MQALELISFSGNPYLVCSLICILALSGNAKARKCRLQRSCILALTEPAKRQILGGGKICLFAQLNPRNLKKFQKES